ncbi:MAG TPA: ATP-grasp domain-containing protein [Candidatus Limnocylindrales bacterium]|nr:ATP-grasp domain-containing protein [Candidatus Limnocylindrales bacterium]
MKIGMLMLRHSPTRISPIMPVVVQLLKTWGCEVDIIYPEERVTPLSEIRVEHDLYILKSGTELALSLAGALHAVGARILNPYPVAATMRDKIASMRVLEAAGVPVPETYVTSHSRRLASLLDAGPLVLKPYRGSQGRGVHVVWDADELDDVPNDEGPVFAQRYHKPEGEDHKIYVIGDQVFGVKRIFPAKTYDEKVGKPFTITSEFREIAIRCGRAFGVELFGFDVVMSEGRPYVVDIQSFPGFKGVPDAALRLADYIYAVAQRAVNGEPFLGAALPDRRNGVAV